MEEDNKLIEEEGISFYEVLRVLFGRKLLLGIITAAAALAGGIGALIYNSSNRTFQSNFTFSESVLNGENAKTLCGTNFDIRNYFTEEALLTYKGSDDSLKDIDIDNIVNNNGICEAKWNIVEETNSDTKETKIVQENYQVVISKSSLSDRQAKAIIKDATNKAISDNVKLLKELNRDEYLDLYRRSNLFEDKVAALNNQFKYINDRYESLIVRFGNVKATAESNNLISDYKNDVLVAYQNINFDGYYKEINNKALVYEKELTLSLYESEIYDLNLELKYATDEKEDLVAQRNEIIEASDGKLTLDLESYNKKIVELTESIYKIQKDIEIINKKIDIIKTDSQAQKLQNEQDVASFNAKLNAIANNLDTFVEILGSIEIYQYSNNMKVFFENSSVITVNNPTSVLKVAAIALAIGLVAGMIVNLCLDGKKLSKTYKKEEELK